MGELFALGSAVVGAAAALLGGWLGQRAQGQREARGRIDERRLDAYIAAMTWIVTAAPEVRDLEPDLSEQDVTRLRPLLPTADLLARVTAFGGETIAVRFRLISVTLRSAVEAPTRPLATELGPSDLAQQHHDSYEKALRALPHSLDELAALIREELHITGGAHHDVQVFRHRRKKVEREQRDRAVAG